jgi:ABC-type phosphate transport system substrate-binding protein
MSATLLAASALLGGTLAAVSAALPAQAAQADYAPNGGDVVGVGSDTLQYALDFGADGDFNADQGYNAPGNPFKLVSLDATGDANARNGYLNNSTPTAELPLNPTVVLRGGSFPVQRPNGGGAGLSALLADTGAVHQINFVRSTNAPTASQGATAVTDGWGGLQAFTIGQDDLEIAADSAATNAPAGLTIQQLVQIYECNANYMTWNNASGLNQPSGDRIIPLIPQAGAGLRTTFINDLTAANGSPVTLGSCVISVEQNDPSAITGLTGTTSPYSTTCSPNCAADAIDPFSAGRLNLWKGLSGNTLSGQSPNTNIGYFHDPNTPFPGAGSSLSPGVSLLTGTPPGGGTAYDDHFNLYVIYRWSDQTASKGWQSASGLNWAISLFCNPTNVDSFTPFFQTLEGKILISQAGINPASQSCLSTPVT